VQTKPPSHVEEDAEDVVVEMITVPRNASNDARLKVMTEQDMSIRRQCVSVTCTHTSHATTPQCVLPKASPRHPEAST
jgi:hypothetical protein